MESNTKFLSYLIVVFMIANIILNHFFRDALFQLGLNLIYKLQQKQNPVFDVFFYAVTLLIDPVVVMLTTFIVVIVVKNKFKAYVTVMFILFNTYLAGVLKAFYADPRPFWANKAILNIGIYCPQQYGNPSGHSWFSTVIAFAVIIQYFGIGKKFEYAIAAAFLMVFVPLSRMYLGAHSLNQVLQGLSLGLSMNFLYTFSGLKQSLKGFLKNFETQPKLFWKKVILVMHMIYILAFLVNQPDINPFYDQIPRQWIKNIKQKCNKEVDTNHLNFMMLMINSVLVNFSTGIGMGFQTMIGSQKGRVYLSGEWTINQHKFQKIVGNFYYYVIQISMMLSGIVPVLVMVMFFGKKHSILFIFGNLGVFVSGYLYSSQSFKYLFNYGIIREQFK